MQLTSHELVGAFRPADPRERQLSRRAEPGLQLVARRQIPAERVRGVPGVAACLP